jgi:four helix bundle protein
MGDFRKLAAWQEGHALALDLYTAFTGRRRVGYPGLRDQILRAAGAIVDCLAEGCGKSSPLELAHYAGMAYSSAKEVESQLERARSVAAITEDQYADFAARIDRVAALCFGLARKKR